MSTQSFQTAPSADERQLAVVRPAPGDVPCVVTARGRAAALVAKSGCHARGHQDGAVVRLATHEWPPSHDAPSATTPVAVLVHGMSGWHREPTDRSDAASTMSPVFAGLFGFAAEGAPQPHGPEGIQQICPGKTLPSDPYPPRSRFGIIHAISDRGYEDEAQHHHPPRRPSPDGGAPGGTSSHREHDSTRTATLREGRSRRQRRVRQTPIPSGS